MNAEPQEIGLIGVGLLGSALADRLLEYGWSVVGFDTDPGRRDLLAQAGGLPVDSAAAVAHRCPRLLFSLPDSDAVQAVVEAADPHLRTGSVIIDTTTGHPQATVALAAELGSRGIAYLDATVAGSSHQARNGDAVLMVGGSEAHVREHEDVFSTIAREVFHVGPCGSGSRMKLLVNLVLGLNRAVLAEGLALSRACGMDQRKTLEVLKSGAAYSAAMDSKGLKMIDGDFSPQARVDQHLKDVRLIQELAEDVSARVPLLNVHAELLEAVQQLGLGDADNSAVIKAYP